MHETYIYFGVFEDFDPELSVVEPTFVRVQLDVLGLGVVEMVHGFGGADVARGFALPLRLDRVLHPILREDLKYYS